MAVEMAGNLKDVLNAESQLKASDCLTFLLKKITLSSSGTLRPHL